MTTYIMRLDDACPHWDVDKWAHVEDILDAYQVKPLVGLIPSVEDPDLMRYPVDKNYWERVARWSKKGWELALHGCTHVYSTKSGGLNPVNERSEFAGLPLEIQRAKIATGVRVLAEHNVHPRVFSHRLIPSMRIRLRHCASRATFVSFRIPLPLSPMQAMVFTFVPQQSGRVRPLPFPVVTFCYHPNTMDEADFVTLDSFLQNKANKFREFPLYQTNRVFGPFDALLRYLYFARRL